MRAAILFLKFLRKLNAFDGPIRKKWLPNASLKCLGFRSAGLAMVIEVESLTFKLTLYISSTKVKAKKGLRARFSNIPELMYKKHRLYTFRFKRK